MPPCSISAATQGTAAEVAGGAAQDTCLDAGHWSPSGTILLVAATTGHAGAPGLAALREALGSYFGVSVQTKDATALSGTDLDAAQGLVILGNGAFDDPAALGAAIRAAQERALPLAWIGPGVEGFADLLGATVATPTAAPSTGEIRYNGVALHPAAQSIGPPLAMAGSAPAVTLATLDSDPIAITAGNVAYVGFDPTKDPRSSGLELAATVDALSHVLGRQPHDRRIVLRLEDINGRDYAQGNGAIKNVTDQLLAEGIFMHLAVIPEAVDENQALPDERVTADIGAVQDIVRLSKLHPEMTEIVQHGFRHSRRDPRNAACVAPGCAWEFFGDDDITMGPETAAAFARSRLLAGRDVVTRHLEQPQLFEAPHYLMSPSEIAVAEEIFPVILHPPLFQEGVATNFFLPWYTRRPGTAYGPSDVGYVAGNDPDSVTKILDRLDRTAKVLPDPVVTVFYHPFMSGVAGREDDLSRLIAGARALGYRFVGICDDLAATGAGG